MHYNVTLMRLFRVNVVTKERRVSIGYSISESKEAC